MRRLVLTLIHFLGSCLAWFGYKAKSEYARVSRININLAFPELSSEEIDVLVRRSINEFGKLAFEMIFHWLIPNKLLENSIRQIHGRNHFEKALAEGRGIIFIHPHLGNWEIFNLHLGRYQPYALYKPIKNRFWEWWITKSRERPGTKMVPFTNSGVRTLYHVLAKGGIIKAFPDQLPDGPGSIVVDFLNVPARTGTLLPRMIHKFRPAVICCYAERLPRAQGFDIHLVPAIEEIYSNDLEQSTAALNKSMEQIIRRNPEQYLWGYKRFKYTVDPKLYSRESPVQ